MFNLLRLNCKITFLLKLNRVDYSTSAVFEESSVMNANSLATAVLASALLLYGSLHPLYNLFRYHSLCSLQPRFTWWPVFLQKKHSILWNDFEIGECIFLSAVTIVYCVLPRLRCSCSCLDLTYSKISPGRVSSAPILWYRSF